MITYIVRRAFWSIVALMVLLVIIFFASRVLGDPTLVILPPDASEAARDAVRESLGLNAPLITQLQQFVYRAFADGFGDSMVQNRPVMAIIGERLPNTVLLATSALAFSLPVAAVMGSIAALKPRGAFDRFANFFGLAGVSMVDFWLGLMLILGFGVMLGWLPTGGFGGLQFLVLPALTLSFRTTGRLAQFTRSAMLDEYSKSYVKTLRAKGLSERRVFLHVFKNASVPVITMGSDELHALLSGSIVVEVVFAWPGLGSLVIQAISNRDLMLIEASVFVIAVMVVVVNLVVDLAYTYLDPRIRFGSTEVAA